jgi:hypothetical protein
MPAFHAAAMPANEAKVPAGDPRVWGVSCLLLLAVGAAYSNTFGVPFLLDDPLAILENPSVTHLGSPGHGAFPTTADRPVLNLSFALNYAWTGRAVWSYHLVNLAVHALAGLTLFGLLRRTLLVRAEPDCVRRAVLNRWQEAALPISGLIAAFWLLHPVQTEAVTYISQRGESLMGCFYLLTLYAVVRAETAVRPAVWLGLSVAACGCGMATKEVMVTAPVMIGLFDWAVLGRSVRRMARERGGYYLGLAASWLILAWLLRGGALAAQHRAGFGLGETWITYAGREVQAVVRYVGLCLWPRPLVFDYGAEYPSVTGGQWLPFAAALIVLAAAAGFGWRRSRGIGFLASAFFILLAPTSSVVPILHDPMRESRLYLPLAAVLTLVVLGLLSGAGRRILPLLVALAFGCAVLTYERNEDYQSPLGLWQDTVAKQPHSSRSQNNLGVELTKIPGEEAAALAHFQAAVRLKPESAEFRYNLAAAYFRVGRRDEAIAELEAAVRLRPDYAEARRKLIELGTGR